MSKLVNQAKILLLLGVLLASGLAMAVDLRALEVGEKAPDFKLPSTNGTDISLSDYRGKKWVLFEFYGADFAPT